MLQHDYFHGCMNGEIHNALNNLKEPEITLKHLMDD